MEVIRMARPGCRGNPCGFYADLCDLSKDYTCLGGAVFFQGEARFPGEEILLQA